MVIRIIKYIVSILALIILLLFGVLFSVIKLYDKEIKDIALKQINKINAQYHNLSYLYWSKRSACTSAAKWPWKLLTFCYFLMNLVFPHILSWAKCMHQRNEVVIKLGIIATTQPTTQNNCCWVVLLLVKKTPLTVI